MEARAIADDRPALRGAGQSWNIPGGGAGGDRGRRSPVGDRFLPSSFDRSGGDRTGSAPRRRTGGQSSGDGDPRVRTQPAAGATRRFEGLHQGSVREGRDTDRPLCPRQRPARGRSGTRRLLPSGRDQGRWSRRRQRRDHRRDGKGGRGRFGLDVRWRVRRRRRGRGDRGIYGRRGSELFRFGRWRDDIAVRLRPGSQEGKRRRNRAEHRRHGRLQPRLHLYA